MIGLVGLLALLSSAIGQESPETEASEEAAPETEAPNEESEASDAEQSAVESEAAPAAESETGGAPDSGEDDATPRATAASSGEAADLSSLEARAMYELGLGLAAKQMWDEACAVFGRIEDQHGETDFAARAASQRTMIGQMPGVTTCGAVGEATTKGFDLGERSGDVELAVSQALAGTLFGAALPSVLFGDFVPAEVVAASTLVGLGSGLAGSMVAAKKYEVSEGQAMAIFTGEYGGAWNGGALSTILFPLGPPGPATPIQYAVAGFVAGGAVGTVSAIYLDPSAADMALVRSGASWGTATAAISFTLVQGVSMRGDFTRMLLGTDVGMIAGIVLADRIDVPRGRMNLINLSGYAGAVVAVGVLGTIGLDAMESQVVGGSVIVLSGVGLGVGAHLTRNMGDGDPGGTAGVGAEYRDGRWRLGVPVPSIVPVKSGEFGIRVPLASGRF